MLQAHYCCVATSWLVIMANHSHTHVQPHYVFIFISLRRDLMFMLSVVLRIVGEQSCFPWKSNCKTIRCWPWILWILESLEVRKALNGSKAKISFVFDFHLVQRRAPGVLNDSAVGGFSLIKEMVNFAAGVTQWPTLWWCSYGILHIFSWPDAPKDVLTYIYRNVDIWILYIL